MFFAVEKSMPPFNGSISLVAYDQATSRLPPVPLKRIYLPVGSAHPGHGRRARRARRGRRRPIRASSSRGRRRASSSTATRSAATRCSRAPRRDARGRAPRSASCRRAATASRCVRRQREPRGSSSLGRRGRRSGARRGRLRARAPRAYACSRCSPRAPIASIRRAPTPRGAVDATGCTSGAPAQIAAHAAHVRNALPAAYRAHAIVSHEAPSVLAYRGRARLHVRSRRRGARSSGCTRPDRAIRSRSTRASCSIPTASRRRVARSGRCSREPRPRRGRNRARPARRAAARGARAPVDGRAPRRGLRAPRGPGSRRALGGGARWTQEAGRGERAASTKPAVVGDPTPWMRGADVASTFRFAAGVLRAIVRKSRQRASPAASPSSRRGRRGSSRLFCGAGNFTVLLAKDAKVQAVERDAAACDAAQANLAARGLSDRARVSAGDAESFVIAPNAPLVVLDPPRTGARDVCARIVGAKVRRVIYVSCDVPTLGRDLEPFADAGYLPVAIETSSQMFPQTSHVETVVALERPRRDPGAPGPKIRLHRRASRASSGTRSRFRCDDLRPLRPRARGVRPRLPDERAPPRPRIDRGLYSARNSSLALKRELAPADSSSHSQRARSGSTRWPLGAIRSSPR